MADNAFTNAPTQRPTDMRVVLGLPDTTAPGQLLPGTTQLDHLFGNRFFSGADAATFEPLRSRIVGQGRTG